MTQLQIAKAVVAADALRREREQCALADRVESLHVQGRTYEQAWAMAEIEYGYRKRFDQR